MPSETRNWNLFSILKHMLHNILQISDRYLEHMAFGMILESDQSQDIGLL